MFDPDKYIINIAKPGKKARLYLQTMHRIMWFRDDHPIESGWGIATDLVQLEPFAVFKCSITNPDGITVAVGYGSAKDDGRSVWSGREMEKAETAAIGRALASAGFGTQFALEMDEPDEAENLADSPVSRNAGRNTPEPAANGHSGPHKPGKWASEKAVTKLMTAARDEYPDVTWTEVRTAAGVDGDEPDAWNVFPTAQAAYDVLMAALDKATEQAVTE